MVKGIACFLILLSFSTNVNSQKALQGFIADSSTKHHLPFSTIHILHSSSGFLSDINGKYNFHLENIKAGDKIEISYLGYTSKTLLLSDLKNIDTIFLTRKTTELKEIVISSNINKIRKIVNNTIANKYFNNPDNYNTSECNIYYKMRMDVQNFPQDSFYYDKKTHKKVKDTIKEVLPDFLTDKSFLMLAETYSKRLYKKPQKINEIVLASRFSGLKKTYFTNTITEVLPFHIYGDFIKLNQVDYVNPIAKGWQNKYRFELEDEIHSGQDTIYLLSFFPKKNELFNSITGRVFINKHGYAISHIIGETTDTSKDWKIAFEQVYNLSEGGWFPSELNYTYSIKKIFSPLTVVMVNGHSIVDSVRINKPFSRSIEKAHSIKIDDSVDLRSNKEWAKIRMDSLSNREQNTYVVLDSFSKKNHLESILKTTSKLSLNRVEIGKFDLDLSRILKQNEYEGLRLGAGLITNNNISNYFSIGGWAAYGFKDRQLKGGASFIFYPRKNKDNWISFEVQHDYRKPGLVYLFEELNKNNGLSWVLREPDKINEYKLSGQYQLGYLQVNPEYKKTEIQSSAINTFSNNGEKYSSFNSQEVNVGLRYAYGEKRLPVLDYYIPFETYFPILYSRVSYGTISSGAFTENYLKLLAAMTYKHHTNRWGYDDIRIEAGLLYENQNKGMPKSFLFATNGIKLNEFSYYFKNGFVTMPPNLFYTDRYANLFYTHDFDKYLWQTKKSKPFISLSYNVGVGNLNSASLKANSIVQTYDKPYQESGIMINQLYKYNLHFGEATFNVGGFYHWSSGEPNLKTNSSIVFSVGLGL